jgi:hypothetical protein
MASAASVRIDRHMQQSQPPTTQRRPAGQDLLRTIRVFKNNPSIADETRDSSYFYWYACMTNVAIWINGTEVAHTPYNNITTVKAYSNGTLDGGSLADTLTTTSNLFGACGDEGIYWL